MDPVTSMQAVVTALTSILTTDAMFTNLAALIPVVGGVLIFAFTYRIIVRIIKGARLVNIASVVKMLVKAVTTACILVTGSISPNSFLI